ncbi:TonB-dependent receptor [Sphingomonas mucosissima]|uniref:Pesticin receptor n=1 Tax=Sphingomonas mucosissima TaxID=370959 RepID=A0A245ZJS8_9SPHN|nr:TonB-dependent receptor [Sphingomonas mucosissima]OWK29993.1 pesticin receptor precursor [Sphingomonas mucosissima]
MRKKVCLRLWLLCGVVVPVTPTIAQAESTAPAVDPSPAGEGLDDIVVTATKRETSLQKTPISISVVDAEMIRDRRVQSLLDLADGSVPSLRVTTFEARQSALTIGIRGIVPLDANQPAREQGVGVYIDGVYLGRQHGLNAALFDTERVEVLRGPQGTLFGRNTEGGALSIVTRAPTGVFGGRVEGGFGNLGAYTGTAHIDLPEYNNLSVKIDAVKQYQGPTTENPLSGQTGWGYFDRVGGRVAARWRPMSDITNDFSYDVAQDKNSPFYSQLLRYNPYGCVAGPQANAPDCVLPGTDYTNLTGVVRPIGPGVEINGDTLMRKADIGVPQQPSVDKTFGFTNNFRWNFGRGLEIRSITAWRGVDVEQWDNAGGAHRPPVLAIDRNATTGLFPTSVPFSRYSLANLRQRQFSQEFQAVGAIDRLDYVAGLFYFNERVSDDAATPNSNSWTVDPNSGQVTGVTINPAVFTNPFARIDRASDVRSRSYAAYGQATWHATDMLHLTLGGRYTRDVKHGDLRIASGVDYGTNPEQAALRGYQPLDRSWNRFDPMVTLAYDVNRDVHVYAKYATGYRAGGASSRTINYQPFDPEDVKSYELGIKTDFWDRRARFNLTGYIMDRNNSQVDINSFLYLGSSTYNNLETINLPGTAKIRGIEADLTVRPVDGLTLNAAYAYTYTRLPLTPITYTARNAAGVVTDQTTVLQQFYVVFTPRNAASGAIDYVLPVGNGDTEFRFHLDGNYAQSTQTFDAYATRNDPSLIFNGRLSLANIAMDDRDHRLTIALWSRNMFNRQYVYRRDPTQALPGAPSATNVRTGSIANVMGEYGNFAMPRTYGLDASIRF